MTDRFGEASGADGAADDRARIRTTRRIVGWSAVLGAVLAAVSGLLGGSGRAGLAILLLVSAAGCGVGALHATATLLVDDLRHRRPSRRRAWLAGGLFAAAAFLMAMVAGTGA